VRSVAPYDTLSFGGSYALSRDGSLRSYPMVWMSREHVYNYVVLHHELGHSFGWPHSSGPYSETYDSRWDIMSRGYIYQDPTYGYLGPHTIAYHKDLTGWLPSARVWRFGAGDPASFLLLRPPLPPTGLR
jgi:M6 family metalloprotease-like protein